MRTFKGKNNQLFWTHHARNTFEGGKAMRLKEKNPVRLEPTISWQWGILFAAVQQSPKQNVYLAALESLSDDEHLVEAEEDPEEVADQEVQDDAHEDHGQVVLLVPPGAGGKKELFDCRVAVGVDQSSWSAYLLEADHSTSMFQQKHNLLRSLRSRWPRTKQIKQLITLFLAIQL